MRHKSSLPLPDHTASRVAPPPPIQCSYESVVRATVERTRRALETLGLLFVSRGPICPQL